MKTNFNNRTKSVVLILSNESLIQKSAVFIVSACTKYNIPVISVHDLASCTFPHPPLQPKQIEDSGIFQDKAITYVKEYFETVLHNTIKQIQSMTQKRNVSQLFHLK